MHPSSITYPPAVHQHTRAGDVGGLAGGHEGDHPGHLLGLGQPAERVRAAISSAVNPPGIARGDEHVRPTPGQLLSDRAADPGGPPGDDRRAAGEGVRGGGGQRRALMEPPPAARTPVSGPGNSSLGSTGPGTLSKSRPTSRPASTIAGRSWTGSTKRPELTALRIAAFSPRLEPAWLPVTAGSSSMTCRCGLMSWLTMS